uniref:Multivesicular body subunit 12B-like n=1 Tax=Phallusia mammillata TaxID=59560 RepID=A0A6F9DBU1_9ASCI|nr:multivesicular body subunit 12B-like [Phallusia mammillata]
MSYNNLSPVTNVCIVSDRRNCPPSYTMLDRTADGEEADFWKDSLFKSKVKRYLCFTRDNRPAQNQLNQVITDLALIGLKDSVPPGYTGIKETADTHEQALRKHILCVRYIVKTSTNSAIVDITLARDNSYKAAMYTLVGEVNGINLTFKLAQLVTASRPAPPPPRLVNEAPVGSPPPQTNQHLQQPSYGSLQRMKSQHTQIGIEGVPFKLNDRLVKTPGTSNMNDLPNITYRSLAELTESTSYDFSREKSIVNNFM